MFVFVYILYGYGFGNNIFNIKAEMCVKYTAKYIYFVYNNNIDGMRSALNCH